MTINSRQLKSLLKPVAEIKKATVKAKRAVATKDKWRKKYLECREDLAFARRKAAIDAQLIKDFKTIIEPQSPLARGIQKIGDAFHKGADWVDKILRVKK